MTDLLIESRWLDLRTKTLRAGSHSPGGEMCAMEAVSWLVGAPWGDHPECVPREIGAVVRYINDYFLEDAARTKLLLPYLPKIIAAPSGRRVAIRRTYRAADLAIRTFAASALGISGLEEYRVMLEQLPPINSKKTAQAGAAMAWEVAETVAQEGGAAAAAWAARAARAARAAARAADWAADWATAGGAADWAAAAARRGAEAGACAATGAWAARAGRGAAAANFGALLDAILEVHND